METLEELLRCASAWALRQPFDPLQARALRHRAILEAHAHYLDCIPAYQRLAQEAGLGALSEIGPIIENLMFSDDIFKSYDPRWLDAGDFGRMNDWLSQIYHQPVPAAEAAEIHSIEAWIAYLRQRGIRVLYSSGTSGRFSFIPRDPHTWARHKRANGGLAAALVLEKKLGPWWLRGLLRAALHWAPGRVGSGETRLRLNGYDAVFLDFARGGTGNQTLEQELLPFFDQHAFLYPLELIPGLIRLLARGPSTPQEQAQLSELQAQVVGRKAENFARLREFMHRGSAAGRRLFIFGAPAQYKELCEFLAAQPQPLALHPGSLAFFGGGWKSFSGEKLSPEKLTALLAETLGLPPQRIMEGYSMTEINAFMFRCAHGRFHLPPTIEPVIFNEALEPLSGSDLRGIFGFLDPLALGYPGFIITGDAVHYVDSPCPCGRQGPALTEIGRAQAREVKGCGGIMASLQA